MTVNKHGSFLDGLSMQWFMKCDGQKPPLMGRQAMPEFRLIWGYLESFERAWRKQEQAHGC